MLHRRAGWTPSEGNSLDPPEPPVLQHVQAWPEDDEEFFPDLDPWPEGRRIGRDDFCFAGSVAFPFCGRRADRGSRSSPERHTGDLGRTSTCRPWRAHGSSPVSSTGLLSSGRAAQRPRRVDLIWQSAPKQSSATLCYAIVLPGPKSAFRDRFRPDCYWGSIIA